MNKMYVKRGFQSLATLFFVLGVMFFTATHASAQVGAIPTVEATDLQAPADAVTTLKNAVHQIHQVLPGLSGVNLTEKTMRAQYYKAVIVHIGAGEGVPESLLMAKKSAIILDETKPSLPADIEVKLEQIYWETVALLEV